MQFGGNLSDVRNNIKIPFDLEYNNNIQEIAKGYVKKRTCKVGPQIPIR